MKNIVLIMTDSQGVNLLGKAGNNSVLTPNIDKLAENGVNFTSAFSVCPLCTPARAGIFTGLYPHAAGAWANSMPLAENVRHMGEYFSDAGYESVYFGKWHLEGWDYFGTGKAFRGWQEQYWYDGRNYLDDLGLEKAKQRNHELNSLEALKKNNITREYTWAGRVTNRALEFINKEHDQPYLLVVSYDEPHAPSVCPPEFLELYADDVHTAPNNDDLQNKPVHHKEWSEDFEIEKMKDQRQFKACATFVDSEIGKIIDSVGKDTLVVFTSDHGHYMGAHSLDTKGPALYDEVLNIPLIFSGGDITGMPINTSMVSHINILPTLLDYAGITIPPIMQGKSLLAFNCDDKSNSIVFSEYNRHSMYHDGWFGFTPIRSARTNEYKLVINLFQTDEFYDLKADPTETNNLINDTSYDKAKEEMLK